jgi:hypothetical protein
MYMGPARGRWEARNDPAYEILEYVCAEGERARDMILE